MTVGKALTPSESNEDMQTDICHEMSIHEPENDVSDLPRPQNEDNDRSQIGRQKAVAAVSNVHSPEMIAKFACALKTSNLRVIEDVCSHYAVSSGEQLGEIVSDE